LPLPSSPHWAPITATFAIKAPLPLGCRKWRSRGARRYSTRCRPAKARGYCFDIVTFWACQGDGLRRVGLGGPRGTFEPSPLVGEGWVGGPCGSGFLAGRSLSPPLVCFVAQPNNGRGGFLAACRVTRLDRFRRGWEGWAFRRGAAGAAGMTGAAWAVSAAWDWFRCCSATTATRRDKASTKPQISASTFATSHCGTNQPACAAMARIRAIRDRPKRSAGGKMGMLFTPCS